jgi:ATP-dependent DNA helicase PIF1
MEGIRRELFGSQLENDNKLAGQHPIAVPYLSMGTIRKTPIDEFNRTQAIFSLAFLTLFPNGEAEYVDPRIREIPLRDYVRHLLLFRDGRFARHLRFRYVAFNMLMRRQVNTKSGFFVRKVQPKQGDLSLNDLRLAFQENTTEAQAIIKSITRFSGTLRGTRPYWYGKLKQLQAIIRHL